MGSTKIKLLISESGMSIAGFARKVGVPQPTLHRIANGEVSYDSMSVGNFMKIAHGLGLSAEELYYDEPHHVEDKREIDVVYNSTTRAGREALLACARGTKKQAAADLYVSDLPERFKEFANSILPIDIDRVKTVNIEQY
jgi:transcriptional regulator with XRE-family HTH domain